MTVNIPVEVDIFLRIWFKINDRLILAQREMKYPLANGYEVSKPIEIHTPHVGLRVNHTALSNKVHQSWLDNCEVGNFSNFWGIRTDADIK